MSMTTATKMLMLRGRNNEGGRDNQYRYNGGTNNRYEINRYDGNGSRYEGGEGTRMGSYDVEDRFRDRRGREHYDNGRFAPMRSEYGGMEQRRYMTPEDPGRRGARSEGGMEMRAGYPYQPPWSDRGEEMNANPIGFHYKSEGQEGGGEDKNISYLPMQRNERRDSEFTEEMAEEWSHNMRNEDGTKGPHWSMEQVKRLMQQKGIESDPMKMWVGMNALYSDLSSVFKKHGMTSADFYFDTAVAFWLNDRDAVKDKLGAYYQHVVKH